LGADPLEEPLEDPLDGPPPEDPLEDPLEDPPDEEVVGLPPLPALPEHATVAASATIARPQNLSRTMPWEEVPGADVFHAPAGRSRAWRAPVRLLPIVMPRRFRGVGLLVVLVGCSGSTAEWTPGGDDAMAPGDDAGGPDVAPGRPDSSPGMPMGHDASFPVDSGGPIDSGSAPVDSAPPPYDGPPGQYVYGPPSGTTGLPGVLSPAQLVTVTWDADTENIVSQIAMAFGSGLGSTPWWGVLSKVCVPGAGTCVGSGVTVTATHVGDPPKVPVVDSATAQSSMSSFPKFVSDKSQPGIGGKPPDLPMPVTASTLYVFFMPQSLPATSQAPALPAGYTVTVDGTTSCGYHSSTVVNGLNVAYAVIPRCQVAGQNDADVAIARAFREIADAVSDPFRASGRLGFHASSSSATAFEIGDFCQGTTTVGGFAAPQIWSDPSMACAP
jgi:hypothetical protein